MTAVGAAVLDASSRPGFLDGVAERGRYLSARLEEMVAALGLSHERGWGLLRALDLGVGRRRCRRRLRARHAWRSTPAGRIRGCSLNAPRPDLLRFMPALNVTARRDRPDARRPAPRHRVRALELLLFPLERAHRDAEDLGGGLLVAVRPRRARGGCTGARARPGWGAGESAAGATLNSVRRSARVTTGPAASTAARSTTFSSSRTLPGQRCSCIHSSASAAKPVRRLPRRSAALAEEVLGEQRRCPPARSRSAGRRMGMTARR